MARFSLETGLQWSQVDLSQRQVWRHGDQAKALKAIALLLSEVAVLTIRQQLGKHQTHVFSYQDREGRSSA
jgi:hypothetical protein